MTTAEMENSMLPMPLLPPWKEKERETKGKRQKGERKGTRSTIEGHAQHDRRTCKDDEDEVENEHKGDDDNEDEGRV